MSENIWIVGGTGPAAAGCALIGNDRRPDDRP